MDNITNKATEHGAYQYDYDDLHRLTSVDNPVVPNLDDESFTYDPVGNRLTSADTTGNWSYNQNNELQSYDNVSYAYDDNGNMTQKTDGGVVTNYIYNQEDRLIHVEDGSSTVIAEYYYDPFGRRLWKDVGGSRTNFNYSDEGLIGEYDGSGVEIKAYGYKPHSTWTTNPLLMKENGNYYFYQNDHLGTPQKMTAVNGAVVWSGTFTSFGEGNVDVSSSIVNNLRFAGQYFDVETGLHYNRFRFYDPSVGRYLHTDPIGLSGGINPYTYVILNPVNFIDPFGLKDNRIYLISEVILGQGILAISKIDKNNTLIESSAKKHDIDPDLIRAIIYEEQSHQFPPYNEDAFGGSTIGLGQFGPEKWKQFGTGCPDDRKDPEKMIEAIAKYLDFLKSLYGDNIEKIGSGYNFYEPGKKTPESSEQYGERIKHYHQMFKQRSKPGI